MEVTNFNLCTEAEVITGDITYSMSGQILHKKKDKEDLVSEPGDT